MSKHTLLSRFLHSTHTVVLASLLLSTIDSVAQAPQPPASTEIGNVIHMVGLDDKPGGTGNLSFDPTDMTLNVHNHSSAIPLRSILTFSVAHDDKALISGTKGKLAEAAPYGIGFAIAMTRPPADTLTVFYRDTNHAIHGCVLVLPKDAGERANSALTSAGLSGTDYPKTGNLPPSESQHDPAIQMEPSSRQIKPSIEVALPSESIDGIPSAFPAAVYEDLVGQLTQSGFFAHVWRAGDSRRTPDALVLHLDIENWKKGSARGRSFGPFAGATKIESSITLVDASGHTVFQGKVDGAKRSRGENLDVTSSLAKHVEKALKKAPELQSARQEVR